MGLEQNDVNILLWSPDGDPSEVARLHVVADLKAEGIAVEAEGGVGIVDRNEHCRDGEFHATTVRGLPGRVLLRSCSAQAVTVVRLGRVPVMVTQAGTASRSLWSRDRYCDGVSPTISVNRE